MLTFCHSHFFFCFFQNANTWYGRLTIPCPTGTFTLQEAPSFAWRTRWEKVRNTYLRDVLTRLPAMTNWQIKDVTPEAWAKSKQRSSLKIAS